MLFVLRVFRCLQHFSCKNSAPGKLLHLKLCFHTIMHNFTGALLFGEILLPPATISSSSSSDVLHHPVFKEGVVPCHAATTCFITLFLKRRCGAMSCCKYMLHHPVFERRCGAMSCCNYMLSAVTMLRLIVFARVFSASTMQRFTPLFPGVRRGTPACCNHLVTSIIRLTFHSVRHDALHHPIPGGWRGTLVRCNHSLPLHCHYLA